LARLARSQQVKDKAAGKIQSKYQTNIRFGAFGAPIERGGYYDLGHKNLNQGRFDLGHRNTRFFSGGGYVKPQYKAAGGSIAPQQSASPQINMSSIQSFADAANNLANILSNNPIPSEIQLNVGEIVVTLNGQNAINSMVEKFVTKEVITALEQRVQGMEKKSGSGPTGNGIGEANV
jgi:hypothetical protein